MGGGGKRAVQVEGVKEDEARRTRSRCVTEASTLSPLISVRRSTPFVQNVRIVRGDTLRAEAHSRSTSESD